MYIRCIVQSGTASHAKTDEKISCALTYFSAAFFNCTHQDVRIVRLVEMILESLATVNVLPSAPDYAVVLFYISPHPTDCFASFAPEAELVCPIVS